MQQNQLVVVLAQHDVVNLLNVLARQKYEGLEEAEVAVVLSHKLKNALQSKQQEEFDAAVAAKVAEAKAKTNELGE